MLCGRCLEVCPLFAATRREELGPRAKALLAQLMEAEPPLTPRPAAARLASLCLGCGRCRGVCPQGVDIPDLVARLRREHPGFATWVWEQALTRARRTWPLAARAAGLAPEGLSPERLGLTLKCLAGLRPGQGPGRWLTVERFPDQVRGRDALLFSGCLAENVFGHWKAAARRLLDGLGARVAEADWACCGDSLGKAGLARAQDRARARNIEVWREAGRPLIAVFCATCLSGLSDYAQDPGLFADRAEAEAWISSLAPLSGLLKAARFVLSPDAPKAVAYHRPCHADRADSDFELLSLALGPGLVLDTRGQCCGFGGVMQLAAPGLCAEVAARCWQALSKGPARTVLTGCSACVVQLRASAPEGVLVGHWLEIIS